VFRLPFKYDYISGAAADDLFPTGDPTRYQTANKLTGRQNEL
jgi:hypothetical protein